MGDHYEIIRTALGKAAKLGWIQTSPADEPFMHLADVKKVAITKTADGKFWAELTHYRSGKYMHHAFKHGRRARV